MNVLHIKAVIFDFDGTLVLSEIDFGKMKNSIIQLARQYELQVPSIPLPALELIARIQTINKKKCPCTFAERALAIIVEEEKKASLHAVPAKGSVQFLRDLKKKGLKIGIITRNCREAVVPVLEKYRVPYDALLTRDDVEAVKPDPKHIRTILRELGINRSQAIVIGDHPFDIKSAHSLGMKAIIILNGCVQREKFLDYKPFAIVRKFDELYPMLNLKPISPGKIPNQILQTLLNKYITCDESVIIKPKTGVDCTVIKTGSSTIAAKADPITLVGEDLGFYLVHINANDLAVTGTIPKWLLTTLLFPKGTYLPEVEQAFAGISKECRKMGVNWAGGHTEISTGVKNVIVCGFMLGKPVKKISRQPRIKPGDVLVLVKEIGIEAASVIAREKNDELKNKFTKNFLKTARNSIHSPGIGIYLQALLMWEQLNIKVMHDPTEGGISTAIYELAEAYETGFEIYEEKLSFYKPAVVLAKHFGLSPLGIISSGCILAVCPPEEGEKAKKIFLKKKIPCRVIGTVTERSKGVKLTGKRKTVDLPQFETDEISRLLQNNSGMQHTCIIKK